MILDFFKKKNLTLRLLVVGPDKDYQITKRYTCWKQAQKDLKKREDVIFFSFPPSKTLYYVGEILDRKQCEALPNKQEAKNLIGLLDHWPVEKLIRTQSGAAPLYGDVAVVDRNFNIIYPPSSKTASERDNTHLLEIIAKQHTHY